MGEEKANAKARRARYRAEGICTVSSRHGPAIRCGLCEPCAAYHTALARRAYLKAKLAGLCVQVPSHGLATHGRLCADCKAKSRIHDLARFEARKRARRLARPTCAWDAAHGPATDGTLCDACAIENASDRTQAKRERAAEIKAKREAKRDRVVMCAFGGHGPAVQGPWCAACIKRRAAAAERIKSRIKSAPQAKIAGDDTPPANHISRLKSHIDRVGSMDSQGLLHCLLNNK